MNIHDIKLPPLPYPIAYAIAASNTGLWVKAILTVDAGYAGVCLMDQKYVGRLITTEQAEAYARAAIEAYQAGQAALQSQDRADALDSDSVIGDDEIISIMSNFGEHHEENGHARYDKWQALDAARAIQKAVILSSQVQAWKLDADRYQYLKSKHTDSAVNSDGKFLLPDLGRIVFEWRRREWKDGKPYVAMEVNEAIDHARRIGGEGE